ncbi:MAG: ABC transporter substrate-binding protein [Betaproteobacteria bacterium]|nr:ABC transporter substrate-binding protein [Betaproteobacteria bacterium]
MNRRDILRIGGGLLAWPGLADAQPGRRYRVAWLVMGDEARAKHSVDAFVAGLRDHGYVAGKNLEWHIRFADGDASRVAGLADELIALKPDVLIGVEEVAGTMKAKTATIPIVLPASSDPVAAGLVQSLARPNTNVTGLAYQWDELFVKHTEMLIEIVPRMTLLAYLADGTFPPPVQERFERLADATASAKNVSIVTFPVRNADDVRQALAEVKARRAQGLVVWTTGTMITLFGEIVSGVNRLRLPTISGAAAFADGGGLLSHGPNFFASFRYAAKFVDRILKGAKPAELPVEQYGKFELVLNLRTARELGLKIPQSILVRADRVIE